VSKRVYGIVALQFAPASPRIMAKATEPDNYQPGLVEWSTTKIIISFWVGQRDRLGGYPESAVQITGRYTWSV